MTTTLAYPRLLPALALALWPLAAAFPSGGTSHQAFSAGEELRYVMNYGIIRGGHGVLSVRDTVFQGRPLYHLVGSAHTSGLADRIFRVRNTYTSFICPATQRPVKAIRDISEGRYRYYNEVLFAHGSDSTQVHSQRSGRRNVQAQIYDILAAFYMARAQLFNDNLREAQVLEIMTFFPDEEFLLRIRFRGIETISTRFGRVECYKFSPVTVAGRAFRSDDDMHIWVSRDKNRIPIRIRFDLVVGSFTCELEEFIGLRHPFSSLR